MQLELLVAPVKWTTTMAIKKLFENSQYSGRVIGAGSGEAALSQIKKNDKYTALLVQWEEAGSAGMELAYQVKERGRPFVVAYQARWSRDDIRRALQLGVDSLLIDPFSPDELVRELRALYDGNLSPTKEQIIDEGGQDLLEPDPALWDDQADDWRERMMGVADALNRPWSEDMSDRASHMEVSVRRGTQIDQISPAMARAVLEVLDQGRDRLPEITVRHKVETGELLGVINAVENFARKHGGATRIPLLMDEVLKRDTDARIEARSPRLLVLKRVARVVIRANGAPGRRRDALNETIKKFLGVSTAVLENLSAQDRFNLAVRFLMTDDEAEALDQAGFVVASELIKFAEGGQIERHHIDALNALLGFDGRHSGVDPKKLIKQLAVLNPIPVLNEMELGSLSLFRDELGPSPRPENLGLASALDQLVEVARPMGPIDQKRIKDLIQAIKHELPVLVGRPAWKSLLRTYSSDLDPPMQQLVSRLNFLIGARSSRGSRLLRQALTDLVEVGRNAMDASRFAEFCRQASAEPLSSDVIAAYVGETHAAFSPDKVERTGAAEERALIEEALSGLRHLAVDIDEVRQSLPPAPRGYSSLSEAEMARTRVIAAVLEGRSVKDQIRVIEAVLRGHKLHTAEIEALQNMLGEGELFDVLQDKYHDPAGHFREGFDYEIEPEEVDYQDNYDYEDFDDLEDDDWSEHGDESIVDDAESPEDDWEDDDIDSITRELDGGAFDVGTEPRPFRPGQQDPSKFDLGLDELEMELDLEGGVFELDLDQPPVGSVNFQPEDDGFDLGSLNRSRDRRTSGQPQSLSTRPSERPEIGSAPPQRSKGLLPYRDDIEQQADMPFSGSVVDGDEDSGGYGAVSMRERGFDIGPSSGETGSGRNKLGSLFSEEENELPLTEDGRLDMNEVTSLVEEGRLKRVARLLHQADDDVPDLALGLNFVALRAYLTDRHHAAHLLWSRANELTADQPNLLYNLARLRIDLGKYDSARPLIERLLELKPHLSLAHDLAETVRLRDAQT